MFGAEDGRDTTFKPSVVTAYQATAYQAMSYQIIHAVYASSAEYLRDVDRLSSKVLAVSSTNIRYSACSGHSESVLLCDYTHLTMCCLCEIQVSLNKSDPR